MKIADMVVSGHILRHLLSETAFHTFHSSLSEFFDQLHDSLVGQERGQWFI
jgi:hypothetical protein